TDSEAPPFERTIPVFHQSASLERQADAELGRERNSHRRSRTEEVAQGSGRHAQLIEAGNRYGASRCGAERSGVGQAIDGRRQGRDIRDVVRARIIAVEEVKELDERYNGTALTKAEGPAHPHVNLDVRGSNQLVEAGLDSVDHGTVVLGVSKTI